MKLKRLLACLQSPFLCSCLLLGAANAMAERADVTVTESSSSGKTIRISADSGIPLKVGEAVLFTSGDRQVARGRVVRTMGASAVVSLLENQGGVTIGDYGLIYGMPFDEPPYLPDYVANRENETENPANEKFFAPDGREINSSPDLDDEDYTPEVSLHPKYPEKKSYNTHNVTLGVGLFRNRALPVGSTPEEEGATNYATYQGYSLRYAYTFKTHYWLREKNPALVSIEAAFGKYSFNHTLSTGTVAQIDVIPIGFNLRYLVEVSRTFRLYPYIGYQNNIVSATSASFTALKSLAGGRLLGGGGAQLVMSETFDSRLEVGSDGVMLGGVVKF